MSASPPGRVRPKVYNVPASVPFLEALALGLLERHFVAEDPASLARVTVLLPTRRAARALGEHLLALAAERGLGRALILPEIRPLGDVDEDTLTFAPDGTAGVMDDIAVADALPPLRRRFMLARLVEAFGAARPQAQGAGFSAAQSLRLAAELERLIDRAETQDVPLDRLEAIVPEALAAHWDEVLSFLKIVAVQWPAIEAEHGAIGPARRRAALMAGLAARWSAAAPEGPVIAAGSTGTIPATAALLKVVAGLPEGAVLLPGLDQELDEDAWGLIDASHPQGALKTLLGVLGLARDDVALWPYGRAVASPLRARLLKEALRPWRATGSWRAVLPDLKAASARSASLGLFRLDLPHQGLEAATIALILREALETPGQTAALVTPDRRLARAVQAELSRWGVDVDDSAGTPLAETSLGVFLRLVVQAPAEGLAPVPLLSLLKHPLTRLGRTDRAVRDDVLALERILRGPRPAPGFAGLNVAIQTRARGPERQALTAFLKALDDALGAFAALFEAGAPVSFDSMMEAHIACAERLARNGDSVPGENLWADDIGEAAGTLLAEALAEQDVLPLHPPEDYRAFFETLLVGVVVRPKTSRHPRLSIWGPLEARLQKTDIVILGGLNEGTWPKEPAGDPWMSRDMMSKVGLPPPEQRLGLSAHDFVQIASAARTAYLTRAVKVDGAPTVASRWLTRLETLRTGLSQEVSLTPSSAWLDWAQRLDEPERFLGSVAPPRPAPPRAARPRRLRVTEIETWVRDPYALYARHVLGLEPLEALDAPPDAALRGTIVHEIMEALAKLEIDPSAPDALQRLLLLGTDVFESRRVPPEIRAFWWPRFVSSAEALLDEERKFRAAGELMLSVETKGEIVFDMPEGPFTLRARADRLDKARDGTLIIGDYKTGRPPTEKEMKAGLAPQLPLEALMAEKGGFGKEAQHPVSRLRVIRLMGNAPPVDVRDIADAPALAALVEAELLQLIARYDDPAYPYRSRPVPKFLRGEGAYDHLARVKEWSAGEIGEEEG